MKQDHVLLKHSSSFGFSLIHIPCSNRIQVLLVHSYIFLEETLAKRGWQRFVLPFSHRSYVHNVISVIFDHFLQSFRRLNKSRFSIQNCIFCACRTVAGCLSKCRLIKHAAVPKVGHVAALEGRQSQHSQARHLISRELKVQVGVLTEALGLDALGDRVQFNALYLK